MDADKKQYIRKDRVNEYLANLTQQLERLEKLPVPGVDFLADEKNFERVQAIKFSLACAIQDVTHIALHITTALGIARVRDNEAESILALGKGGIIPQDFAEEIKGMPSFRNRLIHDYLPTEFDVKRLYENLQRLDDFRKFASHITEWMETEEESTSTDS